MRTYSHIRRKALDEAAAALEPSFKLPEGAALCRVSGQDGGTLSQFRQSCEGTERNQEGRHPWIGGDRHRVAHARGNRKR